MNTINHHQPLSAQASRFINSGEVQKKLITLLQKYDVLRYRSKIQAELDRLLEGEYKRWQLSYELHKSTGLPLDKTDKLALALFENILKSVLPHIEAISKYKARKIKNHSTEKEKVAFQRKPLNLKDIFGEESVERVSALAETVGGAGEDDEEALQKAMNEQERKAVSDILGKLTITLTDEQKKKLQGVIISRLKNIRDAVDTRLALSRPAESGGVALNDTDASTASMVIEQYVREQWQPKTVEEPVPQSVSAPVAEEASMGQSQKIISSDIPITPTAQFNEPSVDSDLVVSDAPKEKVDIATAARKEAETAREAVLETISTPETGAPFKTEVTPPQQPPAVPQKEAALEIGYKAKERKVPLHLVGPVEELAEMTIEDWRRLYKTAEEAKRDIKEKIERLGKESFTKRMDGLRAWQSGNIMKLYLAIGSASMERNESISSIAEKLQSQNQPYLTDKEFHAIMDVNRELRNY